MDRCNHTIQHMHKELPLFNACLKHDLYSFHVQKTVIFHRMCGKWLSFNTCAKCSPHSMHLWNVIFIQHMCKKIACVRHGLDSIHVQTVLSVSQ